jgi:DNA-binding CsgD family transcriptional regulator/PAS domain-containing protein
MSKPMPPFSIASVDHARLHKPLLALHAALEMESLWKATAAVLRAAFEVRRVTLFLGHIGLGEARFVRTDPPIEHVNEWYSARGRENPFSAHIDSHPGLKYYRFSDVLPPREKFLGSEFYLKFAKPEGWDKGVSVLFWEKRSIRAMFSLYRSPRQPEFDAGEIALLHYLYPFIETAIIRIQKLHTERLARRNLEEFAWNIPVGLVLLDWTLKVEFANPEARRICADWNLGPEAARAFNARDIFALPAQVLRQCELLRDGILARDAKQFVSLSSDVARINHPTQPGSHAQITVLNSSGSALATPRFLIVLDERRPAASLENAGGSTRFAQAHLPLLTPSERKIVEHLCTGLTNAEIAQLLNKSVLTVKTQLNSVFRKLGIKSRAKLMAYVAAPSS